MVENKLFKLLELWVINYTSRTGRKLKAEFRTYLRKDNNTKLYIITNKKLGLKLVVNKACGNNYFQDIQKFDKQAKVYKII